MTGSSMAEWVGSPNHYNGRQGHGVTHITLHIMVGRLVGTDATFLESSSGASAHYGIGGDGTIHQYVDESNGSWSDANAASNCSTISIEHEGGMNGVPMTAECIDASARLCADISRRYGLGKLWHDGLDGNVWLHREILGTDHAGCPDLAPNGLPYQQVIDKANTYLQGVNDMPVKTDPITWNGQNVTVEYALQDLKNRMDAIAKRLGPISDKLPFDYLPAILNNLNSLFVAVGQHQYQGLSDDQLSNLATSLKQGLGAEVAKELAKRLND